MAQITLTLDLTVEAAEALRALAIALNGSEAKTDGMTQMSLDDLDNVAEEKPAAKPPAGKLPKTGTPKKEDKKPEAPVESKPTTNEAVDLTIVRAAALKLSKADKQDVLKEIFEKYGAAKLSDVPQADYPALLADLEEAANGK